MLVEHWDLLPSPLLYLSLAFKRRQQEYYRRLSAVRTDGDWEGWTAFFVELTFKSGGPFPFKFTTEVSVVPDRLPYASEGGSDKPHAS